MRPYSNEELLDKLLLYRMDGKNVPICDKCGFVPVPPDFLHHDLCPDKWFWDAVSQQLRERNGY